MNQFNQQEFAKYLDMNQAFQLFLEQQREWLEFLSN